MKDAVEELERFAESLGAEQWVTDRRGSAVRLRSYLSEIVSKVYYAGLEDGRAEGYDW